MRGKGEKRESKRRISHKQAKQGVSEQAERRKPKYFTSILLHYES